jgi:hypothetical protein
MQQGTSVGSTIGHWRQEGDTGGHRHARLVCGRRMQNTAACAFVPTAVILGGVSGGGRSIPGDRRQFHSRDERRTTDVPVHLQGLPLG